MTSIENNSVLQKILSSKFYFLITIAALTFLEIEPFNDIIRFVLFFLLIAYSVLFFSVNVKKLSTTPLFGLVTTFFALSTLSFIIHGDFMRVGFSHIQYIFLFFNASVIISNEDMSENIKALAKWFTIFGLFICLFPPVASLIFKNSEFFHSLKNPLWQDLINAPYDFPNRYDSMLNPNHIAILIGVAGFFSFILIYEEKRIGWIVAAVANVIASFFFIIFAYASRSSMAFLAISFGSFVILSLIFLKDKNKRNISLILLLSGLAVLALMLILFMFSDNFRMIMLEKVLRVSSIKTATGRDIRHKLAIEGALASPVFGVPLDAYSTVFSVLDNARYPHNMFLDIWLKFGTPCFIIYIAVVIYSFVVMMIRMIKTSDSAEKMASLFCICLLLGIVVQSLVEDCAYGGYYIKGFTFSLIFGFACCKEKVIKEKD